MASSASEEAGCTRSLEGQSNGQQRCQSSEALAERRSSEQVENGTPSTSPPYWDRDDDEDDATLVSASLWLPNDAILLLPTSDYR